MLAMTNTFSMRSGESIEHLRNAGFGVEPVSPNLKRTARAYLWWSVLMRLIVGVVVACAFTSTHAMASIIEISIAPNSQANSRPSIDNVYDDQAVGGVFNDNLGIGIIINPSFIPANVQSDFALHQNGNLFPPSAYSGFVPNPLTSSVLYTFDHPTIVSGVAIVEHFNGVTGVGGHLGNSVGSLASLGTVLGSPIMTDGTIEIFDFGNTTLAGQYFGLTIDQTFLSYAFAIHRAYLLDENGHPIPGSTNGPVPTPEPATYVVLVTSLGLLGLLWRRRKHRVA